MTQAELIQDITKRMEQIEDKVSDLKHLSMHILNARPSKERWSTLENIEHLNKYNRFYVPLIVNAIKNSKKGKQKKYKSGWLGNYFAKSMIPSEEMRKIKTFKEMDPIGSELNLDAITEFQSDNRKLFAVLSQTNGKDLNGYRIPITISKFLKLRVLDMLRVVIYHQERHMVQIAQTLEIVK